MILTKLLLEVTHHARCALISVLIVVTPPLAPNAASISSLLLMDLALNAVMDSTPSITSHAKSARLIALIVLTTTAALIALQDSVLMGLIAVGHVPFPTVSYVSLQIYALPVSLRILLIIPPIPVIVNILMSYWQIIHASVLLEEAMSLEITVDVGTLNAHFATRIQAYAQHAYKASP